MKTFAGFKGFGSVALGSLLAFSAANAVDINVSTYGKLGALGSIDFSGGGKHFTGVLANAGADFSLTNGFRWGLGAIGAWTPYDSNSKAQPYASAGDASEAYIGYKNRLISFYAGRFKNDFMKFDWLQGNVQGLSLRFTTYEDKMVYWLTYANSYLYNGKQHNYLQGDRIAGDLSSLTAYMSGTTKNSIFGQGELIAGGVDFTYKGFLLKPFVLFHSKAGTANALLLQGGAKAGYTFDFKGLEGTTVLQGMFQYWDRPKDSISGLVWGDQSFRYKKQFLFGAGVIGVLGGAGSHIYALSDSSKFYGRSFAGSNIANPAPYFANGSFYGYIFGGFDFKWVRLDAMAAFGTYQEYSVMSNFHVWQQSNMGLDLGVGYAYIKNNITGSSSNFNANALRVFAKFSY
ncbi:hypothetical protein [Helicobacter canis]|uniref:Outer membrane family protein n=1 Tax=Helicobacter canis TaxID=29419 RepID=A0A5M9QSN2_9HELI|nr:hypothetical protein [Helicobacter canis]KAA8711221.1 hypothetical protein F4V45_01060 [Helicobacter canis]